MPEYRRSKVAGGTYFFTLVTYHRQPILTAERSRSILHAAWNTVASRYPFVTDAICLLPDHLHCIWTLPEGDANYPLRWSEIKKLFTMSYLKEVNPEEERCASRKKRGEAAIWQRRYWEHTIRDEHDLNIHRDYIHFNPKKHGWVKDVSEWPWSSFQRYVKMGYYQQGWGDDPDGKFDKIEFGEVDGG